jgi:hypothetical protein
VVNDCAYNWLSLVCGRRWVKTLLSRTSNLYCQNNTSLVQVYLPVYTYTQASTPVHRQVHLYLFKYTCTQASTPVLSLCYFDSCLVCVKVYLPVYTCTQASTPVHSQVHVYTGKYTCTQASTPVLSLGYVDSCLA